MLVNNILGHVVCPWLGEKDQNREKEKVKNIQNKNHELIFFYDYKRNEKKKKIKNREKRSKTLRRFIFV